MIFRMLRPGDRDAAQALWQVIFEEEPAFTAYYFDQRFYPKHSFGAFDNGALVAMALGRPTVIRVNGEDLPALLVAGVSTKPDYRGRRLMHSLMNCLIDHAKENKFACCYLHPVSETLYASLGFRTGTDLLRISSVGLTLSQRYRIAEGESFSDMLAIYRSAMQTHNGMQLRSIDEFRIVFADYTIYHAKTLLAFDRDQPIGYICCSDAGTVFELIANKKEVYETLLSEAAKRAGKSLQALAPTDCGIAGERLCSMQYFVFDDAFLLPLQNGYCCLGY